MPTCVMGDGNRVPILGIHLEEEGDTRREICHDTAKVQWGGITLESVAEEGEGYSCILVLLSNTLHESWSLKVSYYTDIDGAFPSPGLFGKGSDGILSFFVATP